MVATDLHIEHESFMANINKHQQTIEDNFGNLRFQIGTSTNSNGATHETKYAYLTEDQATFIATLSRNTPHVVAFKADLVKKFSEAKTSSVGAVRGSLLG